MSSRLPLSKMAGNGIYRDRIFSFEGHHYVLVSNEYDKKSKYAQTGVEPGYFACFNINSRTIRGIFKDTTVEVSKVTLKESRPAPTRRPLKKAPSDVTNRLMDPKEIELRSDALNNSALNRVQRAISKYLENLRVPDEIWDEVSEDAPQHGRVVVDTDIPQDVQDYLQSKGFQCSPIMEERPNNVFYPPTKSVLAGYEVCWQ